MSICQVCGTRFAVREVWPYGFSVLVSSPRAVATHNADLSVVLCHHMRPLRPLAEIAMAAVATSRPEGT